MKSSIISRVFLITGLCALLPHAVYAGTEVANNQVTYDYQRNTGNTASAIVDIIRDRLVKNPSYNQSRFDCDIAKGNCLNDLVNSGQVTLQIRADRETRNRVLQLAGSQKCDEALGAAIDANDIDLAKDVRSVCKK